MATTSPSKLRGKLSRLVATYVALALSSFIAIGTLPVALGCVEVNFTNAFVSSSSDMDPFDTSISKDGGQWDTQSCESVSEVLDGDHTTKWVDLSFGNGTSLTLRLSTVCACVRTRSGNAFLACAQWWPSELYCFLFV